MQEITILRKAPRVPIIQNVLLNGKPGLMVNLSVSGARFKADVKNFERYKLLKIDWPIFNGTQVIQIKGSCVWIHNDEMGVHFEKLDKKVKFYLNAMIRFHRSAE